MVKFVGTMFQKFVDRVSASSFARLFVLAADLMVVAFSVLSLYAIEGDAWNHAPGGLLIFFLVFLLSFLICRPFSGIVVRTCMRDVGRILFSNSLAFLFYWLVRRCSLFVPGLLPYLQNSQQTFMVFLWTTVLMVFLRFVVKYLYWLQRNVTSASSPKVMIYGTGDLGLLVCNAIMRQRGNSSAVAAFIDADSSKSGKRIEGVPVYTPEKALTPGFVRKNRVDTLVLALQSVSDGRRREIVSDALSLNLHLKYVPQLSEWLGGEHFSQQMQDVEIEDLLGRKPISLDVESVRGEVEDKVVLVTGAAGSIGSELVRQVLLLNPRMLVAFDAAESAVFDLQFTITSDPRFSPFVNHISFVVGDVRDKFFTEQVFAKHRPDCVFHAAAYKHVPLMEDNPYEAVLTNVFGTKVLADLSMQYAVKKFVMISTDKAVNPTNVMGATKRLAEVYVQSRKSDTRFITTRFGNVLGSNGSVIPLFRKQLAMGGPLTVTHREVTRYFMTIPEACGLVLEATSIGAGGDVLVFDMGNPVKIYDLAKNMILLSNKRDVEIREVGLRPGEKLYEELLFTSENTIPTKHPRIMHAKVVQYDSSVVDQHLAELWEILRGGDLFAIVSKIKSILPEYISNNSQFERLDKKK